MVLVAPKKEEKAQGRKSGSKVSPTRFVGRVQEKAKLIDVIAMAKASDIPQIVTVSGNRGTGKTRLVEEALGSFANKDVRLTRVVANAPRPYGVLRSFLRARLELDVCEQEPGHSEQQAQSGDQNQRFSVALSALLGTDASPEAHRILGSLLDLEFRPTPFLTALSHSKVQNEDIVKAMMRVVFLADARRTLSILFVDDMQKMDAESRCLLREVFCEMSGSSFVFCRHVSAGIFSRRARVGKRRRIAHSF